MLLSNSENNGANLIASSKTRTVDRSVNFRPRHKYAAQTSKIVKNMLGTYLLLVPE